MDWIASILSIVGTLLCGTKNIWCWPVWIIASSIWIVITVCTHQWALCLMFSAYQVTNIMGWIKWNRDGHGHTND